MPPVVEIVADEPDGLTMLRSLAPPPEFKFIVDAPDAEIAAVVPKASCGVLTVTADAEEMVSVVALASVIEPPVACELNATVPDVPTVKV